MQIDTSFNIHDMVQIIPLNHPGTIVELRYDGRLIYVVEYFWEGLIRVVNLMPWDIKLIKTHRQVLQKDVNHNGDDAWKENEKNKTN